MLFKPIFTILLAATAAVGYVGSDCKGYKGAAGVCTSISDCNHFGGKNIVGACPNDPQNIRCCTKPGCARDGGGHCKQRGGRPLYHHCPGPANWWMCILP